MVKRSLRVTDDRVRISLEILVGSHPFVHRTAGRALMVLLQELQDDRVPVHLVQIALSGRV
jgi:hypothetical protein